MLTYLFNVYDIVNGVVSDKWLKSVIYETTMDEELILYNDFIDGINIASTNRSHFKDLQMDIYIVNMI